MCARTRRKVWACVYVCACVLTGRCGWTACVLPLLFVVVPSFLVWMSFHMCAVLSHHPLPPHPTIPTCKEAQEHQSVTEKGKGKSARVTCSRRRTVQVQAFIVAKPGVKHARVCDVGKSNAPHAFFFLRHSTRVNNPLRFPSPRFAVHLCVTPVCVRLMWF